MELRALNILEPPRIQVALYAGYSNIKSTGFSKACTCLKKEEGIIEYPTSNTMQCSAAGVKKLSPVDPPADNTAVQVRLRAKLKNKADLLFNMLTDGKVHRRALSYSNLESTEFSKALSQLSTLGVITCPSASTVQLNDIAFPYGRPGNAAAAMASAPAATLPTTLQLR